MWSVLNKRTGNNLRRWAKKMMYLPNTEHDQGEKEEWGKFEQMGGRGGLAAQGRAFLHLSLRERK